MDVKKLPVDVQSLLSASARINNYKKAVEELVYNSLDAESTCIAIRIHIQNNSIQVIDNGIGIKNADYKLLGERYATSKLLDINTLKAVPNKYGYQGQALANIITVSQTVKITSRCSNSSDTWVKTFVEGKIEQECFKAPTRPSKGTTVEVNGFLYNLNIQKTYVNTLNELQDIKSFLQQLLLVFNNVSISVRDDSENEIIFKMHKNRDIYQTLKSLFDIDTNDIQEFQVEKNDYKVKAFIGTDKPVIKNCNWVYLNNKFINISNLNAIINNKFTKTNTIEHKKNKSKGVHPYCEEKYVVSKYVLFYFLFITCPYYEYDILNSGKQTVIEFKDWTQINNLIEKLVKFYNGDINLMNVQKSDNQKQVSKKVEDTRDEIKKIMEKILGKPNKLGRISEMQNGIKGKHVKRRRKKQQVNINLKKIIPPKNTTPHKHLVDSVKVKLSKSKVVEKATTKYCDFNKQPKRAQKTSKSKINANKKNHKLSKISLKCKCNKKYGNFFEIFKNEKYSTTRECNKLSSNIKDFFNIANYANIKNISINNLRDENRNEQKKQGKCTIKESKIYMNINSPDIMEFNRFRNNKTPICGKITSYDLLQTIIKTQPDLYNHGSKGDLTIAINISNAQPRSSTKRYGPELTFDSHKYNINGNLNKEILAENMQSICKQSKDNVNVDTDKHHKNFQIKTGKILKHHGLMNAKYKKHNIEKFHRLLNNYQNNETEKPFSIDLSGTDIVEFSKQIRNHVMKDMNSLFDNVRDNDKISSPKTQLNYGLNMNIERTYTIIVDSYCNTSQPFNKPNSHKAFIDTTASRTNASYHDRIHSDHANTISNEIRLSQPQHTSKQNVDNPLDVCEAILNSPKDFEDDFNNIPTQDSLLIFKEPRNINCLLNKNSANRSQLSNSTTASVAIKENEEIIGSVRGNNELTDQIEHRNEKFGTIESEMIQDNSIHNFKLNTRHKFVPKGMSQIFKNCFSKNICSYNLDTEYYENTIYNDFVKDIAVNSEIFEPKVQNVKENIQKVTENHKKHNADLIFGTGSLKGVKVLGQVDRKFIAAIIQAESQTYKSSEFLVFFDQHAVHERIRLEKNLSHYFIDGIWKKDPIDTFSLKSSKDEILYLHNHNDKFARFGLEWTVLNNSEILVNAIPEAIRGKNPRPMDVIVRTVKDLISEQMHAIKYLKGNVSLYPQSIMNLVFSEACRYAIKFGDILSMRDCVELIATLANCKIPFQCAHGRPVMAVMVELQNEHIKYKANMKSIEQFKNRVNMQSKYNF